MNDLPNSQTTHKSTPVRRRVITSAAQQEEIRKKEATVKARTITEQRNAKREEDKKRFLTILEEHLGIISYAAQQAGIPRRTIYDWMDDDPDFNQRVRDIDNKQLDFVERKLLENVKGNDTRAIIFYLSTKGRNRGYTTRVELTTPAGQPLQSEVSITRDEARSEMSNCAMSKALKAAARAFPDAFTDGTRIAACNGDVDAV